MAPEQHMGGGRDTDYGPASNPWPHGVQQLSGLMPGGGLASRPAMGIPVDSPPFDIEWMVTRAEYLENPTPVYTPGAICLITCHLVLGGPGSPKSDTPDQVLVLQMPAIEAERFPVGRRFGTAMRA